ncbi:hypothetical protein ACLOJK_020009 [Asimina triloba]
MEESKKAFQEEQEVMKVNELQIRIVLGGDKQSWGKGSKKVARAHRREQVRGQMRAAKHEEALIGRQTAKEKRGWFFILKENRIKTSTDRESKEIFRRSYDMEAWVLKILEDLLLVELRAICEDTALSIEHKLDIEGRGPKELKLEE